MGPAPLPERAYPKRKRAAVKYYETDSDDAVSDEELADEYDVLSTVEGPANKKLKGNDAKLKSKPDEPLPKKKIFPFMELPAELKNQIYDLALRDPNGIYLSPRSKQYRRTVQRDLPTFIHSSNYGNKHRRYGYSYLYTQSQTVDVSAVPIEIAALVPNIMLLNREIYEETQPILYSSNEFFVEDTATLHAFLANIGTKNVGTMTNLIIKGWGHTKAHKAMNHPALTILAGAVNLERLYLDCRVDCGSGPQKVARQFYRDAFHYLEGIGTVKGQFDAAVAVLEIRSDNLEVYRYNNQSPKPTAAEDLEAFKAELRKLLSHK